MTAAEAYHLRKNTGTSAAKTATACSVSTYIACLGDSGSHLIAKNATIGICVIMSSCQRWAAVPSSACRAVPNLAMWTSTVTTAADDIANGKNALGRFIIVENVMG